MTVRLLVAVLDACVLYPMPLCDTLLRLAAAAHYQPRWTAQILDEAHRNLVANGRMSEILAVRRRVAMERAFPDALVEGHEPMIDLMHNHAKDRHVTAAAVACRAQLIVTANERDFVPPPDGVLVWSPDRFLCELVDLDTENVLDVLRAQVAALRSPPVTLAELLARLAVSAPRFVARVRAGLR
jgi:hypothetical protein